MKLIKKFLLLLVLIATVNSCIKDDKNMKYYTNNSLTIPFSFQTGSNLGIYNNPNLAIFIMDVFVDDKQLIKSELDIFFDDFDFSNLKIKNNKTFTYVLEPFNYDSNINNFYTLFFVENLTDDDFNFKKYEIPVEFKEMKIRYKIRFPNGKFSKIYEINVFGEKFKRVQ